MREAARARHRIEHHQSNILCTYDMFISSKLVEIELFEIFFENQILLEIQTTNFDGLEQSRGILQLGEEFYGSF